MSEPAIRLVVQRDSQTRVDRNRVAAVEVPSARLEASKVLAHALVAALEGEGFGDRRETYINLRELLQRFEANLIRSALANTGGRQRRAARLLGMNVSSLNVKIKRYKLDQDE